MTRAARAVINLSALQHNLQRAKTAAPRSQQFSIIKANGYGHGLVPVAQALKESDGFGVASVEEALALKAAEITQPVLLLEGFFHADELEQIQQYDLQIVVHQEQQLVALEALSAKPLLSEKASHQKPITVWLKVDTGMHRLGFDPDVVPEIVERLMACDVVNKPLRMMTHLANADDMRNVSTQQQIELFKTILADESTNENIERSIANSAGILGWMGSYSDLARPGILLYGVSPFLKETGAVRGLLPAMTLRSELISIKQCQKGDAVGYGGEWVCPQDMPVGVVGIGYGDGYPRHAAEGTPVLIDGKRVPLVGRVSMDMICVDLRECPEAQVGSEVVLWGDGLPAEEVAESASTIAYDLFCGVTSRVPREYVAGSSQDDTGDVKHG
ncbi:MAG: alanine racemase [Gammaproteobacteria bacterium]|nr:alanine racemase [Gammaproteobacteria bacterium]